MQIKYFSDLGDGWGPAVLETEVEHDFIRQSERGLTNAQNYFIAGSAFPNTSGSFDYSTQLTLTILNLHTAPFSQVMCLKSL